MYEEKYNVDDRWCKERKESSSYILISHGIKLFKFLGPVSSLILWNVCNPQQKKTIICKSNIAHYEHTYLSVYKNVLCAGLGPDSKLNITLFQWVWSEVCFIAITTMHRVFSLK